MTRGTQHRWLRFVPGLIAAVLVGCAHIPKQSEAVKRAGLEASTAELRTRAVELGRELMREIELAADSISSRSTDPAIRRNCALLKLSTLSAGTEAVLRQDPVVTMLDLYAFRVQLSDFLSSPAGYSSLGPDVSIAQRTLARIASMWEGEATAMGAHFSDEDRGKLESWAHANPIDQLPFTRATLAGGLAQKLRSEQSGIGVAVSGMQESLDRLEARVSLANEYAIKQAMWLSEFASIEVGRSPEATELKGTLASTRSLMEYTPEMIASERAATLADLERQRLATLEALVKERMILTETIAHEREIVLQAVAEQRAIVMRQVDSLRVSVVVDGVHIVDHLMLRIVELIGALVVLGAIALLVLRQRS